MKSRIMSVKPSNQYTIYTLPRRFKNDAKLHPFLAIKAPDMIQLNKVNYTLFTVLSAMRSLISNERLYDPNNTTVIICSLELEAALGMKSLHVTEVRDVVLTQMEVLYPGLLASIPDNPADNNRALAQQHGRFDVNGRFYVKPHFLRVLRMVNEVDKSQQVFSYKEVTSYLSQYILDNKDRFFDDRNIKIAHVENDPLGIAFNVKAFHRTQVTTLLRNQLIPVRNNGQNNLKPPSNQNSVIVNRVSIPNPAIPFQNLQDPSSRKRSATEIDEPSPKGRRRSLGTILSKDKESEDEAIDTSEVDKNESGDEEQEYDVYEIEYEPEDVSDNDTPAKKSGAENSSGESDIDEAIVVATVAQLFQESDDSDDADASSEEDQDFTKGDLENLDSWTCLECKQPNTPYIRYCSQCYNERKGWLPARPKPKKKRNAKTLGVPVKPAEISESQKIKYERSLSEETVKTNSSTPDSQDSGFGEGENENLVDKVKEISSDEEILTKLRKNRTSNSAILDPCGLCLTRPKDACLIHGRTSHQLCCYKCAKQLYKQRKPCPICRRKIEKITKNIVA